MYACLAKNMYVCIYVMYARMYVCLYVGLFVVCNFVLFSQALDVRTYVPANGVGKSPDNWGKDACMCVCK